MAKKKFYAVWTAGGVVINRIFENWDHVKRLRPNRYKGFKRRSEAELFLAECANEASFSSSWPAHGCRIHLRPGWSV